MKYYFKLQYNVLNRQLSEFGLHPILGYSILLIVFLLLSNYLFAKVAYAVYIYMGAALGLLGILSGKKRQTFLKSIFSTQDFRSVRIIENLLLTIPFVVFLIVKGALLMGAALIVLSAVLALVSIGSSIVYTIPTPFSRYPFEFIIGFRRTFVTFPIAYFLVVMGIQANHANLCFFAMILVFLVCLSYYGELESSFYVWVYALGATAFLTRKIGTALLLSTLISLPISIATGIYFPNQLFIQIGIQLLGSFYLIVTILAKYVSFPSKMQLPQALMLGFSMVFPPFMLVLIPYFYRQSLKKLNQLLV